MGGQRTRGSLMLVLALAALGLALYLHQGSRPQPVQPFTLTTGPAGTTRALLGEILVERLRSDGAPASLVDVDESLTELDMVDSDRVNFAALSGALRIERKAHVREVAPLYVEALHLLVRPELAAAATAGLAALRGHTVDIGPPDSATAGLAASVLTFAGVPDGYERTQTELAELVRLTSSGAPLPDAVFVLDTVPSKIVLQLVRHAGYRLVPLPFAESFRLSALVLNERADGDAVSLVEPQHVVDTEIPAFSYATDPPVPAAPLHTLGTRLLLVAHEAVPIETVILILDTVLHSRLAQVAHPPLDRGVLTTPPRIPLHAGTIEYVRRDQPVITDETIDELNNTVGILGALVGGGLFLWQFLRERRQHRREGVFAECVRGIADIEARVAGLELAATLELEPLVALQRQVLELKAQALERFTAGELGDQAALSDLLTPLNAARDHIANLLLHVREQLEDRAEEEGRTVSAVWTEAIRSADAPRRGGS